MRTYWSRSDLQGTQYASKVAVKDGPIYRCLGPMAHQKVRNILLYTKIFFLPDPTK